MSDPEASAALRRLPAVGALLASPEIAPLIEEHGKNVVKEAIRAAIASTRERIIAGDRAAPTAPRDVVRALETLTTSTLRRVINGTGVLLHTNLGRAPLAVAAMRAIEEIAGNYSSVEFDVTSGERGDRHAHISELFASLLETDGALAFNNCAGAVLLMLAALCRGREVIVARGELVEIGGGFRVPDVMRESGAILIEVGTTNKVYARDYEAGLSERTAAILKVHRSNFAIVGFTEEPTIDVLASVAQRAGIPLLADLGSGLIADDNALGPSSSVMRDELRPGSVLARGAGLVAFSGDKLFGGPQAGIIAGKKELLDPIRKHPLARALRADKLTLAALEATGRLYRDGRAREIPVIRDLSSPMEALSDRAHRIEQAVAKNTSLAVSVVPGEGVTGGGSMPLAKLPTRLVLLGERGAFARTFQRALRSVEPPVIARIVDDRVAIDVRTIRDDEVNLIGPLIASAEASVVHWEESTR